MVVYAPPSHWSAIVSSEAAWQSDRPRGSPLANWRLGMPHVCSTAVFIALDVLAAVIDFRLGIAKRGNACVYFHLLRVLGSSTMHLCTA